MILVIIGVSVLGRLTLETLPTWFLVITGVSGVGTLNFKIRLLRNTRAGIDSANVDITVGRALFPDCRQACFTVDSEEKERKKHCEERLFLCVIFNYKVIISAMLHT